MNEYPQMIYKDGKPGKDYRIVNDEAALKAAAKDGYLPAGQGK